jgi:hypothetical protein
VDPNAALARIRHLCGLLSDATDGPVNPLTDAARDEYQRQQLEWAEELAQTFEGLDGWLTRKGFLPAQWHRND